MRGAYIAQINRLIFVNNFLILAKVGQPACPPAASGFSALARKPAARARALIGGKLIITPVLVQRRFRSRLRRRRNPGNVGLARSATWEIADNPLRYCHKVLPPVCACADIQPIAPLPRGLWTSGPCRDGC